MIGEYNESLLLGPAPTPGPGVSDGCRGVLAGIMDIGRSLDIDRSTSTCCRENSSCGDSDTTGCSNADESPVPARSSLLYRSTTRREPSCGRAYCTTASSLDGTICRCSWGRNTPLGTDPRMLVSANSPVSAVEPARGSLFTLRALSSSTRTGIWDGDGAVLARLSDEEGLGALALITGYRVVSLKSRSFPAYWATGRSVEVRWSGLGKWYAVTAAM